MKKLNFADGFESDEMPDIETYLKEADIGDTVCPLEGGLVPLENIPNIPSEKLPSYVDDILEFATVSALPVTGETGKVYVELEFNRAFRWSGSTYVEVSPSEVTSVNSKKGAVILKTSDIAEETNLYWTGARFDTAFSGKTTDNLTEGTRLYYTQARFNTAFTAKSTNDLSEGSTNKYFTDARAKAASVVNSAAGSETDQAASVNAMKTYVNTATAGGTYATQAEMEAASATDKVVSPGRVKNHPGVAKAWMLYDGAGNALNGTYNVSSVTDNGVGSYTVNFTVPFSSVLYAFVGCARTGGGQQSITTINRDAGLSSTGFAIYTVNPATPTTLMDANDIRAVWYGDQ